MKKAFLEQKIKTVKFNMDSLFIIIFSRIIIIFIGSSALSVGNYQRVS